MIIAHSMLAYALTILLSSFLLFLVQPLIGKHLLPWFGGVPSVWTTCLLLFQALLLAGYAYSHVLSRRLSLPAQRRAHRVLLVLAAALLAACAAVWGSPLLPGAAWRPADASHPIARVLLLLAVSVGLPYFLLATTTPLLQAWLERERPGSPVYRLYAVSNLGSLAAPIVYLALVEPRLTLRAQAAGWSLAFLGFAAGAALCAGRAAAAGGSPSVPAASGASRAAPAWLWFALSACGSLMLLAATNQMTQEVAAVPFLWVLPLGLYLLSFILCFQSDRLYARGVVGPMLAAALGLAALVLYRGFPVAARTQVLAYSAALFAACMVCHGELARTRPEPARLTGFYLMIAAGGVAGGMFVALLAPRLFPAYWEIHVGLFLSGLLAIVALLRDRQSWLYRGRPWPALLVLLGGGLLAHAARDERLFANAASALRSAVGSSGGRLALGLGAAGVFAALLVTRPIWWTPQRPWFAAAALAGGLLFLGFVLVRETRQFLANAVSVSRGFYGVVTVEALDRNDPQRSRLSLRHGRIVHGFQYQSPDKRRVPTTYYVERSGIGRALKALARRGPLQVGVVGLGTGTLAAYGRPGDTFRFYEINPQIVDLAAGPRARFTYLRDSAARIELAHGDARLSLEREIARRPAELLDLLAVDAFSSDSIPVHLLTREALELYLARLRQAGLLALHVSNRHLDLLPVVRALAGALRLETVVVDIERSGEAELGSTWALLSRAREALAAPEIAEAARPLPARAVRVWTDDYSNLFQVLK